jgi:hypothetical protein
MLSSFCYGETAGYAGSKSCFACHSGIYRSFAKTAMGRSMRPANELSEGTLPGEAAIPVPTASRVLTVFRDQAGWHQRESEPGVFQAEHKLDFAVGSGTNGFTFLVRRDNYLFQAPLSFYSRTGKWDLSPGYEQADVGFGRMVPGECVGCHAGRAMPLANRPGAYEDPPFAELAIGCENCHGPGEAHVKALGNKPGLIVNPARLPARLAENICIGCHQTGDARVLQPGRNYRDFRPGQWFIDTALILKAVGTPEQGKESDLLEHYAAMQASRCFRMSAGKLNCLSCHDPHVQQAASEAPAYFRQKCLGCHNEQSCTLPQKTRRDQKPPDDCAGCHMPKRKIEQIAHSALTNHRIPARDGEPMPEVAATETNGFVVVNPRSGQTPKIAEITLLRAYRDLVYKDPRYQQRYFETLGTLARTQPKDSFVQAALGHKALADGQLQDALDHLTKAIPLGESTVYLDLGQVLGKLNRGNEAIEYLKTGERTDPYNALLQKTLILQYINDKRYAEAKTAMEEYLNRFPEDSFMRSLWARVR